MTKMHKKHLTLAKMCKRFLSATTTLKIQTSN